MSHERKLEADRAALTANQKERKGCEGEIQVQEQKITKLKDQMLLAKRKPTTSTAPSRMKLISVRKRFASRKTGSWS